MPQPSFLPTDRGRGGGVAPRHNGLPVLQVSISAMNPVTYGQIVIGQIATAWSFVAIVQPWPSSCSAVARGHARRRDRRRGTRGAERGAHARAVPPPRFGVRY